MLFLTSCQVPETLHLNKYRTVKIEIVKLRNEESYLRLSSRNYSKEEIFQDTTYAFKGFIAKYLRTFSRLLEFLNE